MMNERQIIERVQERLDEAGNQCNSGWMMHTDGVIRGLLWALTGEDHGTYLMARTPDIYKAMGCKTEIIDEHVHYWMPWEDQNAPVNCEICSKGTT